jgi:hypothetical protein
MKAGFECNSEQLMPGRMKFDLIETVTETIKRPQLRGKFVGIEPKLNRFGFAQRRTQRSQLSFRPPGTLASNRLAEHGIA